MIVTYLAIEQDISIHERESKFWLSRNVSSIRVSSMREGIEKAISSSFLYIGINASNIDYLPYLRLLREVTKDPIFISTATYTMQEQGKALENGADLFGQISDNPSENYTSVMACINRLQERAEQRKPLIKIATWGDIFLVPSYHKAFIADVEIRLTKNEMGILHYLLLNKGNILSHEQIYREVFNREYDESSPEVIYSTIRRMRKKIKEITPFDYIENVRDVGYRIVIQNDKID